MTESWYIESIEVPSVETVMPTKRRGADVELRCIFEPGFEIEYEKVAAHADVAGNYTVHTSKTSNSLRYTEKDLRDDTASGVNNVVLSVDTPPSLSQTPSFWGALDSVDDSSVNDGVAGGVTYDINLSFTIIALKRDIPSRAALESQLKGGKL